MLKYFSIVIGGYGINIRLIEKNNIIFNEFYDSFNAEQISRVSGVFADNRRAKIYILLDNIGQNYTIKKFPLQLNIFELRKLVNRKFDYEIPKTDLRTKIFCGANRNSKEWEYLFVSSPIEEILKNVLNFIDTLPNFLVGIFMLPLESTNIVKTLSKKLKLTGKLKPKWILLLIENKISGIRQIAFKNGRLIFTRFLYNLNEQPDKKSKILFFENDISRTIGFMKRFGSDFNNNDLLILGITTSDIKNVFNSSDLKMIKSHYFSSWEVATMLFKDEKNAENYKYCDRIFEKYITSKGSVFPFFTTELKNIKYLLNVNSVLKLILTITSILFLYVFVTILINFAISYVKTNDIVNEINLLNKKVEEKNSNKILKDSNINKIIAVGTLYSEIKTIDDNFYKSIDNMSVLTYKNVKIKEFVYSLNGFDHKSLLESKLKKTFHFSLLMNNDTTYSAESIVEIFNAYKKVVQPTLMKNFAFEELNIKKLDFGKKYYYYQFDIDLEEK